MIRNGSQVSESAAGGAARDLRAYFERVFDHPTFAVSTRRGRLLRYLIEQELAGKGDQITEYAIGLDVLGKPASFDTRIDSSVRAEMSRLRRVLADYYDGAGRADPWRIEFPNRGYAPAFKAGMAGRARWSKRWMMAGVAALAMAGAGVLLWRFEPWRPSYRSVVVLPFENLTGDAGNDYLADGVTEELTDSLARFADLRVVARTSAFQFKGKKIDIRQAGRQLNVDAAIEGSIRKMDGQVRLTVQVNRTRDGYHIMSRSFDGSILDLGRLEREMSQPVRAALRPGDPQPNGHVPNGEAKDWFLKAKALRGKGTDQAFLDAVTYLNRAIESDPSYADAYAALAGVYANAATNLTSEPLQYVPSVRAAAAKALELDPASARAYAAQGYLDGPTLLDWKRGEQELRKAIGLLPQEATQHNWLGLTLLMEGRFEEALKELRTAQDLDPLSGAAEATVGFGLYCARRYDEAMKQFDLVLSLHPEIVSIHIYLGDIWEAKGQFDKAMAEYRIALPKMPDVNQAIAYLLAVSGKPDEARRILDQIEHPPAGAAPPDPFGVALIYGALGDRDRAFGWLDRAYQNHKIALLKVHPMLDPLRSDPRYPALLKKVGLDDRSLHK
ncbi:MAG TPA: tetratricopeptide repeat protein [Bryobacteraceae bacterium]|nr:tetratricopeptide repeat protein [Bryobacteraceae bacterium]